MLIFYGDITMCILPEYVFPLLVQYATEGYGP